MLKLPGFVDMAHTPQEVMDEYKDTTPALPIYPYGLSICLGNDELEKLDLDTNVEVGDRLFMDCIAKVTSVSSNETTEGTKRRIELTITHIALEESEEEEEVAKPKVDYRKLYKAE